MTWLEFKDLVDDFLFVDGDRKGTSMATYKTKLLNIAVKDLQRSIEFYRVNNETTFSQDDVTRNGNASQGVVPSGADIQEVWIIREDKDDATIVNYRIEAEFYPWTDRDVLTKGDSTFHFDTDVDGNAYCTVVYPRFTVNPQMDTFYVTPPMRGDVMDIDTMTYSAGTGLVTVTMIDNHGYVDAATIAIAEAIETGYNGDQTITKTGDKTFTFSPSTVPSGDPATTATTLTAQEDADPVKFLLVWNGVKLSYIDGDTVPFDEDMAFVVSLFVKAHLELQMGEGIADDWKAEYRQEKGKLFIDKKGYPVASKQRNRQTSRRPNA